MADSSQMHTKKSTEKVTAEKRIYSEHSILYHRSEDPSNGSYSLHPKYTQHQKNIVRRNTKQETKGHKEILRIKYYLQNNKYKKQ